MRLGLIAKPENTRLVLSTVHHRDVNRGAGGFDCTALLSALCGRLEPGCGRVRGAYGSRGGKSVIAFASTTRGGTISKIVPHLSGPVTTPRNDVHFVATEYGIVNLKSLSSTDRAIALIGLAHPNYRRRLTEAAQSMHLI